MQFKLNVSQSIGEITCEVDEARQPKYMLTLAHGAGAGMNHSFMKGLAQKLIALDAIVIRFNFPYKEQGKKLPGSPKPNLETLGIVYEWSIRNYPDMPLFMSGKSYGGRMSSHFLAGQKNHSVKGIIYFGFPLHPPGKPEVKRAEHLYQLEVPQLFLQGTRDALANLDLITEVAKKINQCRLIRIENADHSFKIPKKSNGKSFNDTIQYLADATNQWILSK